MRSSSWFNTLLMYYHQWEQGFLPEKGGVNDQPAKFGEYMTTLKVILTQVEEAIRPQKPNGK